MENRTTSIYSDFEFRFEEDLIWFRIYLILVVRFGEI